METNTQTATAGAVVADGTPVQPVELQGPTATLHRDEARARSVADVAKVRRHRGMAKFAGFVGDVLNAAILTVAVVKAGEQVYNVVKETVGGKAK